MGIPKNPYACAICQKSFPIAKSLLEHTKTNHESLYSSNESQIKAKKDYIKNITIETEDEYFESILEGNKPLKYEVCDHKYDQKDDLKKHVASVHERNKPKNVIYVTTVVLKIAT